MAEINQNENFPLALDISKANTISSTNFKSYSEYDKDDTSKKFLNFDILESSKPDISVGFINYGKSVEKYTMDQIINNSVLNEYVNYFNADNTTSILTYSDEFERLTKYDNFFKLLRYLKIYTNSNVHGLLHENISRFQDIFNPEYCKAIYRAKSNNPITEINNIGNLHIYNFYPVIRVLTVDENAKAYITVRNILIPMKKVEIGTTAYEYGNYHGYLFIYPNYLFNNLSITDGDTTVNIDDISTKIIDDLTIDTNDRNIRVYGNNSKIEKPSSERKDISNSTFIEI